MLRFLGTVVGLQLLLGYVRPNPSLADQDGGPSSAHASTGVRSRTIDALSAVVPVVPSHCHFLKYYAGLAYIHLQQSVDYRGLAYISVPDKIIDECHAPGASTLSHVSNGGIISLTLRYYPLSDSTLCRRR